MLRTMLTLLLLATACAASGANAQSAPPPGWPAGLRWDLVPKWIHWENGNATVSWPPNDGCADAQVSETIPAGTLIDRFGNESGSIFGYPKDSFKSRSVPFVCKELDYRVYKVLKPLPVKACKAAPWFGEPGGAKELLAAKHAQTLVAEKSIEMVSYELRGSGKPAPPCGGP